MVTEQEVKEALKDVIDPHVGVSLVDMDLIKDVAIDDDVVKIKMMLTTPFCPLSNQLVHAVKSRVEQIEGVERADVELVF
ncbi:MAG: metal-sulfur cluster assembly factor [Methanocellales archaeon]|nr:metal-sulfur cluster assembly factor [Methanocellales archaeon]